MPERRTQSYAAVPQIAIHVEPMCGGSMTFHGDGRVDIVHERERIELVVVDPEDFEPELPPSPTFWPRDEPKEPPP